jgi:hypothetical protein
MRVLNDDREPGGFLGVVSFGSSPNPSPHSCGQVVSLSQSSCESPIELIDGRAAVEEPI